MSDKAARRLIVGGPRDGQWFSHPGHPDGQVFGDDVLWFAEPAPSAIGRHASPMSKVPYYAKTYWNPAHRATLPLWVRSGLPDLEVGHSVERVALTQLGATFHPES